MSDRVVAVKLKCADILPSRLATRVTINCDPASEIKLSALAPQACVRSEQQVKMVTLHSSNLDTPMSPLGHSLPRHPVPVVANVRYASISDQI